MMPVMTGQAKERGGRDPRLTRFAARWLAETVRLREASGTVGDDGAAVAAARRTQGDAEHRIVVRAARLAGPAGHTADLLAWRGFARGLLIVLLMLAFIAGVGSVASVVGFGAGTINIVWVLIGLLGVPTLMLALWLASLLAGADGGGSSLGRVWLWLSQRRWRGSDPTPVVRGLYGLLASAGLLRWALGAVSHGFWAVALIGALIGLGVALSIWEYGFVWQTTILPAGVFVAVVDTVGWLPGQLGFPIPDADLVRASGGVPVVDQAARQVWAAWLAGAVLIYGLLPRVALLGLCLIRLWRGLAGLKLDLRQPYYAALAARLAPASERLGMLDGDDHAASAPRLAEPRPVESRLGALVAVEWAQTPPDWPSQPAGAGWTDRIDGRASRQRLLVKLAADPPARLLLTCDPRLSPDRGVLALIAALSRHAGETRLWLPEPGGDSERREHWRQALTNLGLPQAHLYEHTAPALAWVSLSGPP